MSDKNLRLNIIFNHMKQRCYDTRHNNYDNCGGRGIKLCDEWNNRELDRRVKGRLSKGFLAFKKWALDNGYKEGLTIDRIDNDGDYSPENCRWVTPKEQANNRRNNFYITYNGKTQTLTQWAEELNLNFQTLYSRLRLGWSVGKAFSTT